MELCTGSYLVLPDAFHKHLARARERDARLPAQAPRKPQCREQSRVSAAQNQNIVPHAPCDETGLRKRDTGATISMPGNLPDGRDSVVPSQRRHGRRRIARELFQLLFERTCELEPLLLRSRLNETGVMPRYDAMS